ncbi:MULTISPECIES: type II toxin-antitoxin system CcdA family antitoxin [unclassified Methanoregula]|uniref:type II toxin-antitoxin system CcdA family antitoxin n=1 Tax=unclassified Methanoregula TaxID=2649730 RepID=UPI0009C60BDA|nr:MULTISPECIES: type II toxin-antitoxin system CcdA family antitoxin [unclassified Methanoregula]OPX64730.1 MAG: hypothetical protein A4E33_00700 [Methanoregula sp. PtaB.Bin085]OPY35200.1 MAG: hypothetical protein A4E34_00877 [Methanoregula sp. PtaU1.Bin006]
MSREPQMTTVRIPPALRKKAHAVGLNVSQVCRKAIKDAVSRMEQKKDVAGATTAKQTAQTTDGTHDDMRGEHVV